MRRSERINLRLDPATDELLREAAGLAGKSLTAFLLDAARDDARRAIEDHRRLALARAEVARLRAAAGQRRLVPEQAGPVPAAAAPRHVDV